MSLLVKAAPGRVVTDITPASAGWKHIHFKALRLQAGRWTAPPARPPAASGP